MTQQTKGRFFIPGADMQSPHCSTTLVRKSRFICQTCRCESRKEAQEFLALIRAKNPDATHNCWAFVAGPPGDSSQVGCSDDGEPAGTAGKPMLSALLHGGAGQICSIVSRWFGGIKLGTGGLCRAYQDAVNENLKTLPLISSVPESRWEIAARYEWLPGIKRLLPGHEARIESEEYGVEAKIVIAAPLDKREELAEALKNLTNGRLVLTDNKKSD